MAHLSMGEAHRRITEFLNRFSDAVSSQDDANRLIKQSDKFSQFGEILASLFRALQNYKQGSLVEAYNAFEKTAKYAFIQEFRNWESAWALEALCVIVYEIRVLAKRADRELASSGKSPEKLKGAGSFLMKVFGALAYGDVLQALRRGDLRLLRSALQEYEDRFLRSGVYLVLEKLELQVYLRLVQKIYIIQKQKDLSKAHQVKLVIVKALKRLEIDMDVNGNDCLEQARPFPKLNGKPVNS